MVFSTPIFLYGFLPLVLVVYYLTPRMARNGWLVAASYFFYGWGNPLYLFLLLFSTILDYFCALGMTRARTSTRRLLLCASLVGNLGVLAFFKYSGFLARAAHDLTSIPGAEALGWLGSVVLPLGISFYTFQSLSYTIDVYRAEIEPTRRFLDFAAYVALFPQLVAGPIVRYGELASALRSRRETRRQFTDGMGIFIIGLAKKLLLANPCGAIADRAFGAAELDPLAAWTGLFAYSFQIYFDFSGYSEMAIGLGMMFGFTLPVNFRAPYRAASLRDFWRRWHITLGSWIRDYLYIPLGGSRGSRTRALCNLVFVMLLAGLWHGAAWQFLTWGAIHGMLLAVERLARPLRIGPRLPALLRTTLTFALVSLAWVVFRSDSLSEAWHYYTALFGGADAGGPAWWTRELLMSAESILVLLVAALITWGGFPAAQFVRGAGRARWSVLTILFWSCLVAMAAQSGNPFLYYFF